MPLYIENDIFISFSNENNQDIEPLCQLLKNDFNLNIWKTDYLFNINGKIPIAEVNKALKASKVILSFISKAYMNSEMCREQLKLARNLNKEVVLILLEDIIIENDQALAPYTVGIQKSSMFKNKHKSSLWVGYHFERLLELISYALEMTLTINRENDKLNGSIFQYFENNTLKCTSRLSKLRSESIQEIASNKTPIDSFRINNIGSHRKLKSSKSVRIKSTSHGRMVCVPSYNRLLVTDEFSREVKFTDLLGNFLTATNPENVLVRPYAICVNSRNQIIIGDRGREGIFLFNSQFEFLLHFGKNFKNTISYMRCDPLNASTLYVTHCNDNELTIWDLDRQKLSMETKLDKPEYLAITSDKIFVTSCTCHEYNEKRKKFVEKLKSGSNCIFILDKFNLNVLQLIKYNDWLQPGGLHVDVKHQIIVTTAYIINGDKSQSDSRYLFFIDYENQNIQDKICLNDVKIFDDMTMYDNNKFVFYVWQVLKYIEVEHVANLNENSF